jgi:Protein of unknown function (DUF2971)
MRFHNDPGHYVAHYTRCDTAVDYILKNKSLRLGPLNATNDPRETKTWHFAVGSSGSHKSSPNSYELKALAKRNVDFDRLLKQGCKILCVSQDAEKAFKQDISDRAYGKPRMWSQYAGNHTGVCLLFDKENLNQTLKDKFKDQELFSGPVEYGNFHDVAAPGWMEQMEAFQLSADDIVANGLEATLRAHRDKHHQVFFYRKNKDWENESEYRWIVHGDTDEPEFIPIETALRAILLGIDFPLERLNDVYEYCTATETSISRIVWINGMPGVHWFEPSHLSAPEYKQALEMTGLIYRG